LDARAAGFYSESFIEADIVLCRAKFNASICNGGDFQENVFSIGEDSLCRLRFVGFVGTDTNAAAQFTLNGNGSIEITKIFH
jgi:hypothetical protein